MPAHLTLVLPPGTPDPAGDARRRRALDAGRPLPAPAPPGYAYAAVLCALFGVPTRADTDVPVGAIGAVADLGARGNACWLRADPVVLAPTRVELRLLGADSPALGGDEAGALVAALAAGQCVPGARWHVGAPRRWYVETETAARVCTTPPLALAGRHVEEGLPRGPDGPAWCAHLNHAQMILHGCAEAAEAHGRTAPAITSVWFWGAGPAPAVRAGRYARVYADDPVTRGLAALSGVPPHAVAQLPDALALAGAVLLAPGADAAAALLDRFLRARAGGALAGLDVVWLAADGTALLHAVAARRRWWALWPRP